MSNVPPLPSDVWALIIGDYVSHVEDRLRLALTSASLRELTLPSIFQRLSFTRFSIREPGVPVAATFSERDVVLVSSAHITERIKFLHSRSDVRGYVHEVVIYGWSARPLSPRAAERVEIRRATNYAYGAIDSILSTLPQLKKLRIVGSPITLSMRSLLPQLPHLESLDIRDIIGEVQDIIIGDKQDYRTTASRGFRCLKELTFLCRERFDGGTLYLRQLLATLAPDHLTRLSIYDWCLPHIMTTNMDLRFLLHVSIELRLDGRATDMAPLYRLLARSQDIREIRVMPTISPSSPPPSGDLLPRLESVSGSIDILTTLVPGRPVRRIELFTTFPIPFRFSPLQNSAVDITSLSLNVRALLAEDITHCGHVLRKLRHFTIQLRSQLPRQHQNCIVSMGHLQSVGLLM